MTNKVEYAFIIPAYNPDEKLLEVVKNIQQKSNNKIFLIDDGSKEETQYIFKTIEGYKDVILLRNSVNIGKGAALKTAFNKILTEYKNIEGVVTLDSDGQHSAPDCLRMLAELEKYSTVLVLGYRNFSKDIPLKSYIGNNISKFIYKLVFGRSFQDTQTGLRGLSKDFMQKCLLIKSNGFEFETEQLSIATNKQNNINIVEIPIETIYIQNNKASSFRPLVDSFKIYFVLLRYGFSSLISALIDIIIFINAILFGSSILTANMMGRSIGLVVNFILLRNVVFKDTSKNIKSFILFALYVLFIGLISTALQEFLVRHIELNVIFIKILVELSLFIINFAFIKTYLFKKRN
jgi:putative flippase GtrA